MYECAYTSPAREHQPQPVSASQGRTPSSGLLPRLTPSSPPAADTHDPTPHPCSGHITDHGQTNSAHSDHHLQQATSGGLKFSAHSQLLQQVPSTRKASCIAARAAQAQVSQPGPVLFLAPNEPTILPTAIICELRTQPLRSNE